MKKLHSITCYSAYELEYSCEFLTTVCRAINVFEGLPYKHISKRIFSNLFFDA